jgi:hypothetical protein
MSKTRYQILYLRSGLLVDREHVSKTAAIQAMKAFTGAAVTEAPETGCLSAVSGYGERDAHACPIPN